MISILSASCINSLADNYSALLFVLLWVRIKGVSKTNVIFLS